MKTWLLAFACLLTPALTMGQCGVEVEAVSAPTFQPSSPNVRVKVSNSGTPVARAQVYVYEYLAEKSSEFSASTGKDGVAVLPRLRPNAYYHVVAEVADDVRGEVYIGITQAAKHSPTEFPLYVTKSYVQRERPDFRVAETAVVTTKIKEFTGFVHDETGAAIPGAVVDVWKKGKTYGPPIEEVKSDGGGRFASRLGGGIYIAFVSSTGFLGNTFIFEVADAADVKDLQVNLRVGECT